MLQQSTAPTEKSRENLSPPETSAAPPVLPQLRSYPDFTSVIEQRRRRNRGLPNDPQPALTVPALADIKFPAACFRSDWSDFDQTLKAVTGRYLSYDSAQHTQLHRMWEKTASRCRTMPGGVMMMALLANPPSDIKSAAAHREALEALRPGRPFRASVDKMFKDLEREDLWGRNRVDCAADLINHEVMAPMPNARSILHGIKIAWQMSRKYALFFSECRNGLRRIIDQCADLPKSDSPLLQNLTEEIGRLKNDSAYSLLTKTIYPKGNTVQTKPANRWFGWITGHRIGKLDLQGKGSLALMFGASRLAHGQFIMGAEGDPTALFNQIAEGPNGHKLAPLLLALPLMAAPIATFGWFNYRHQKFTQKVLPALRNAVGNSNLSGAYSRFGYLDALCALADLREEVLAKGWRDPTIIESDRYYASFSGMRNPFLELGQPGVTVPNDFELKAGSIASLSGPNSGGKTTLGLSLFWNTVFGQLGLPIPCESATYSCTDYAFYQGPQFSGLNDEGRLGFELERMHDVLNRAGPKSLVVVDEMTGATSLKSGRKISARILWGLSKFNPGIVLITHDFNYARRLEDIGLSTNYHFGWNGTEPTFKLTRGVSDSSHADAVAQRVGVDKTGVKQILLRRLPPPIPQEPSSGPGTIH